MQPTTHRRAGYRDLVRDRKGAAYVEFLIAFLPVLLTFLGLWQFGILCVAELVTQHAAACAARAAAVAIGEPQSDLHALSDGPRGAARDAALLAAAPLVNGGLIAQLWVEFPAAAGAKAERTRYEPSPDGKPVMVRVRVTAEFVCTVAPVNLLVCGLAGAASRPGATKTGLVAEASFPYQGARYTYEPAKAP